jgi:hypothetical protein
MDVDGFMEIIVAKDLVVVYESHADDVWAPTFAWSHRPEMINMWGVETGVDTDGNGKPELFVYGTQVSGVGWTTLVYESTGDDQYGLVAVLGRIYERLSGQAPNALGNFDGIGGFEYVMDTGYLLQIYGSDAVGHWEVVQEFSDRVNGVHAFDVNQNGRDELFWGRTIYEQPDPSTLRPTPRTDERPVTLVVFPNPARSTELAWLEMVSGGPLESARASVARISLFDVVGRLVTREPARSDASGRVSWPVRVSRSGVYWVRLEDSFGTPLAVGRATLVR